MSETTVKVGMDPNLFLKLAAPFEASEIKFRPGAVAGNRALALHYVDARVVQNRLDEVMGVAGWQDEYNLLPDGSCVCKLQLLINGQWITKMDVGSPSEQPDEGDRHKAAFSDALKRAAVKFGIGRYLYNLPQQWAPYDPQKRKFVSTPTLPAGSLPAPRPAVPAKPAEGEIVTDEQYQMLGKAMHDAGLDPHVFCDKYKLCDPSELPAALFDEAMRKIELYRVTRLERAAAKKKQAVVANGAK